jgi:superfamily I DNA/RNA helicase
MCLRCAARAEEVLAEQEAAKPPLKYPAQLIHYGTLPAEQQPNFAAIEAVSNVAAGLEPDSGKIYGDKHEKLADRLRKAKDTGVDQSPHLIVEARAGTGKTTTLVEGVKRMLGQESDLTPSPQQKKIWDAMYLSAGRAQTICFVAFNRSIRDELKRRLPDGCEAYTLHGLGLKSASRAFGRGVQVSQNRVDDLVVELTGSRDKWELQRRRPGLLQAVCELVSLCKMDLTDPNVRCGEEETTIGVNWELALSDLASYYDVDLNSDAAEVFRLVPQVLDRCKDVARDNAIDYDDMIWLPVALGLPVFTYDVLLVDEAQDLNRCQQALAQKAGRRLILCGDPKQAIYGFAGADADSMPRMERLLSAEPRGCLHLPLTVTRRCGRAIVAEARRYVLDFEAHEACPDGVVGRMPYKDVRCLEENGERTGPVGQLSYVEFVRDGDMILCRCNAPLVSQCFRFLKAGRKAYVQGRAIGDSLVSLVERQKCETVEQLLPKLEAWLAAEQRKENAKRHPSKARLIALQDRYDCLVAFCENMLTTFEVTTRIKEVFSDASAGIRLSSVHRAKGLEADRVFILQPKEAPMPHPMAKSAWEREQERNLCYVAITRAIRELIYVS